MSLITVEMIDGSRFAGDDDRERAKVAAYQFIADAGLTVPEAFAEFKRQWEQFDDYAPMTGAARVWIDAEAAANEALTAGWARPEGASCSISA